MVRGSSRLQPANRRPKPYSSGNLLLVSLPLNHQFTDDYVLFKSSIHQKHARARRMHSCDLETRRGNRIGNFVRFYMFILHTWLDIIDPSRGLFPKNSCCMSRIIRPDDLIIHQRRNIGTQPAQKTPDTPSTKVYIAQAHPSST
jgi:hypothetical protein